MVMNDNCCVYVVEIKGEQYVEYKTYERRVNDLCRQIEKLESELEVKDNLLKIKNWLCGSFECLPSEPVSVANILINAKEEYEPTSLEKVLCKDINPLVDKYSIDDLEQIAEHLLVYCKHNRGDDE